MGICYMLQYMDKLALSQATLFNLQEDLVGPTLKKLYSVMAKKSCVSCYRISKGQSTTGPRLSSISDTSLGAGRAHT